MVCIFKISVIGCSVREVHRVSFAGHYCSKQSEIWPGQSQFWGHTMVTQDAPSEHQGESVPSSDLHCLSLVQRNKFPGLCQHAIWKISKYNMLRHPLIKWITFYELDDYFPSPWNTFWVGHVEPLSVHLKGSVIVLCSHEILVFCAWWLLWRSQSSSLVNLQ